MYFIKYSTGLKRGAGAETVEGTAVRGAGAGTIEGPTVRGARAETVVGPGSPENTSNRLFFSSAFIVTALVASCRVGPLRSLPRQCAHR